MKRVLGRYVWLSIVGLLLLLVLLTSSRQTKWRYTTPLDAPEALDVSELLPDGTVFVYYHLRKNSESTTVAPVHMFNPKTEKWTDENEPTYDDSPFTKDFGLFRQDLKNFFSPTALCGSANPEEIYYQDELQMAVGWHLQDVHVFVAPEATPLLGHSVLKDGREFNYSYWDLPRRFGVIEVSGKWASPTFSGVLPIPTAILNFLRLPDDRFFVARSYGRQTEEEIYDPVKDKWLLVTDKYAEIGQTATLLPDGKILLIGGCFVTPETWIQYDMRVLKNVLHQVFSTIPWSGFPKVNCTITSNCRVYDPANNKWSFTYSLNTPRAFHTATLLPDRRIMVTGGYIHGDDDAMTNTCEIISLKDIEP